MRFAAASRGRPCRAARSAVFAVLALCGASAQALDFKSVGASPAILYDTPSVKGKKLFVAPRGMPVEVVLTYGDWVKVRDASGDMAWLEAKALAARRTVVVNAAGSRIRAAADDNSAVVFSADKGVLLDLLEPAAAGWVKVRHRDGQVGFIKSAEVWGE
ncbi:SH3 domain-containing protein [Noviherbaspirillum humi]|uniref:SH3 domain-containing protein n=1 Tax=Noviherbaspirillum humi TaxID=1688639 RepID=A0A239CDQ6_9BURK|nr:SH3 domain-containing protein [Noviherbaspirillum humi]SNS18220.1 SH3 domain-containing protein [Noviherbaspirillum humi]